MIPPLAAPSHGTGPGVRPLASLLLAAALAAPAPAQAFYGGGTTSDPVWSGVGSFSGGGCCTGTLIGPNLVLTSAHVVSDAGMFFNFTYAGANYSIPVAVGGVHVHPDYGKGTGGVISDSLRQRYDDLAVVKLTQAVPQGVPYYALYEGDLDLLAHPVLTLVGRWGGSGRGIAENRLDVLLPADTEPGQGAAGLPEILAYDYDGGNKDYFQFSAGIASGTTPLEGIVSGGDSGSPIFIRDGDAWKLVGVSTFNASTPEYGVTRPDQFGAIAGGTYLKPYQAWIGGYVSPVPEPRTWLMLLAGLGLLGTFWRHRQVHRVT